MTRDGLADARKALLPDDWRYTGIEEVRGDVEWNITGLPKCLTKQDIVSTFLGKNGWKILVGMAAPDKFDRQK